MPLLTGMICLALAISLCVAWWSAAFVAALEVLLVLLLFVWGAISTLVGYSALKAQREFENSAGDDAVNDGDAGQPDKAPGAGDNA